MEYTAATEVALDFDDDEDETGEDALDASDGTAEVVCPYCGEAQEIAIDQGGGADQEYIQDCEVCCRPWNVHVAFRQGGSRVTVTAADDADDQPDDD